MKVKHVRPIQENVLYQGTSSEKEVHFPSALECSIRTKCMGHGEKSLP